MSQSQVHVRRATREDIPRMLEVHRAAYPSQARSDLAWGRSHLESHQRIFPQGQIVAELDGELVGAVATLMVTLRPDPLRNHTWAGITESGYFYNHDPNGDTLYGADVYIHPEARGKGVGHALYEARRQLCKRLNLRRILFGGQMWNYWEYADQYTPEEYAERVAAGELHDLVLSFQIQEGFEVRGVMPNYLVDERSHNYACLMEWLNPDHQPRYKGSRKVRLACVQYQMRVVGGFDDFARQVSYFTDTAADYRADFVTFPELFTMELLSSMDVLSSQEGMWQLAEYTDQLFELLRSLATSYGITIIGGSHPVAEEGRLYNVCPVCLPDGTIVTQPKLHITPSEQKWWSITGGNMLSVIDTPKLRIGVLICYDVQFPEAARHQADEGAEVIFVPFCTDTRHGYLRVRYCSAARAIENQVYVPLAGNVGNLPNVDALDINYGQAAVHTPSDFAFARDGIQAEADSNEETVLVTDVDLDDLHEARHWGTVTPRLDRRPDLFEHVAHLPKKSKPGHRDPTDRPLGPQPARADLTSEGPLT